jgi:cell division initiation protein
MMTLTPVEIRHIKLARGPFGYRRRQTDELLDEIAASFEDVWRERADLSDEVEHLEADLLRHRELEALLRTTLVSAEKAAATLKEDARRQADLIVSEANAEARAITRRARTEHERLEEDVRRLRVLLRSALETIQVEPAEEPQKPAEAA